MNRDDFDKAFQKVNQKAQEEYFSERLVTQRYKDFEKSANPESVYDWIGFSIVESKTYTEKYIYSILEELLNVDD